MNRFRALLLLSVIFLSFCKSKAQVVVSDKYYMHDNREILTDEIQVPTTTDDIIVKLHLIYHKHKSKSIPAFEWAWFTIDFKKSTTGTISPYYYLLKTKNDRIIQSQYGRATETYSYVPKGWRRLEWHVKLEKKSIKEFTKEPIKKIRLAIGWGVEILDIEFLDESLTNYIRDAHNAILEQSKTKLDESTNPPQYDTF